MLQCIIGLSGILFWKSRPELPLIFILIYYSVNENIFKGISDINTMHCHKSHVINKNIARY